MMMREHRVEDKEMEPDEPQGEQGQARGDEVEDRQQIQVLAVADCLGVK